MHTMKKGNSFLCNHLSDFIAIAANVYECGAATEREVADEFVGRKITFLCSEMRST